MTQSIQQTLARAVSQIDITSLASIPHLPVVELDGQQAAQLSGLSPSDLADTMMMDCVPAVREMLSDDGTPFMVADDLISVWHDDLAVWLVLNQQGSDSIKLNISRNTVADLPNEFISSTHRDAPKARKAMISQLGGSPLDKLESVAALFSQSALLNLVAAISLMNYCSKVKADIAIVDAHDDKIMEGYQGGGVYACDPK
jgi:hypothetical protein